MRSTTTSSWTSTRAASGSPHSPSPRAASSTPRTRCTHCRPHTSTGCWPCCDAARDVLSNGGDGARALWASLARRVHAEARWPEAVPGRARLEDAAFADDERRRYALTESYVRDVLAMFYSGASDVQVDRELQAFAADLALPAGGAVAGFPSRIATGRVT